MEPLHLIIAEAALELIPREIWYHDLILKHARKRRKKPWEMILDISLHYRAMLKLPMWKKRGRPDIVHMCLLNALSSPLNKEGLLRVYIHTFDDRIIFIDPSTRIPRHYMRFVGLMEQLLVEGKVPPDSDKPLMWWKRQSIREFVEEMKFDKVILLHEEGTRVSPRTLGEEIAEDMKSNRKVLVMVGGFQHGDFREDTKDVASIRISIFRQPLDAWIVVSRIIEGVEHALKIYEE